MVYRYAINWPDGVACYKSVGAHYGTARIETLAKLTRYRHHGWTHYEPMTLDVLYSTDGGKTWHSITALAKR